MGFGPTDGKKKYSFSVDLDVLNPEALKELVNSIPEKGEESVDITMTEPNGKIKTYKDCSFVISKDGRFIEWFNENKHGVLMLK